MYVLAFIYACFAVMFFTLYRKDPNYRTRPFVCAAMGAMWMPFTIVALLSFVILAANHRMQQKKLRYLLLEDKKVK